MHIGRGRQHGEHEAKRAGQNMALDPLDLLVAINTALALLRSRHNALRIKDGGGRLGGMAVLLAHRTREHTANVGPDPVVWRNRSCQVLTVSQGPKSLGR